MRNRFGHLPDQSMHEKTAVPDLIREMYTSLRQADEVELCDLFDKLKKARDENLPTEDIIREIDSFQSHVVPIVADIDAGYASLRARRYSILYAFFPEFLCLRSFGNVHATFLLRLKASFRMYAQFSS